MALLEQVLGNLTWKETHISVPGFKGYSARHVTEMVALGIAPIMGGDGTDDMLRDLRIALGIAEDGDPVAAIKNIHAEIAGLKATIASDKATADVAEMARLQNDLAEAKRSLIIEQSENARKIAAIEAEARKDKAIAKVEKAIASGKPPAMREQLLEVALMMAPEKFDDFLATVPTIDLTERGVATGSELAELEPTSTEIAIAKQMGNWNEVKATESRLALMRQKARDRGLTLPDNFTGAA